MTSEDKRLRIDFSAAGDSSGPQAWGGGGVSAAEISKIVGWKLRPRISTTNVTACIYRCSRWSYCISVKIDCDTRAGSTCDGGVIGKHWSLKEIRKMLEKLQNVDYICV